MIPRRHKYGAKKVKLDGYTFDSKAEAKRYEELKLMEKAGRITDLEVHPVYCINFKTVRICKVILDFKYFIYRSEWIYEDVKGVRTPVYRLKKKLLEATHGIRITEIPASKKLSWHRS